MRLRSCALALAALACTACAPRPKPFVIVPPAEAPAQAQPAPAAATPRLIVQITIDQLRADLLTRYADRYTSGGLRRLLDAGVRYDAAYYAHAITETAVGHATLFTGALPSDHGIVGNEWYDLARKRPHYAVEDDSQRWLAPDSRPGVGTSPRALRATTLGDELILASARRALVFAVSFKDRSAILPGGHAGKAFWYDDSRGAFTTSDYYYRELPAWASDFERARPQDRYLNASWDLLLPRETYVRRDADDRPQEREYKTLGRTFPHSLASADPADTYKMIKRTPFGDELTLLFVEALLAHEPLGRDEVPDLLSISFSSTDAVGHAFGPESLEAEDNLLRLDRTIARLFEVLLARVPERELLVVLSADHGGCETPEALRELGIEAGRHDPGALVRTINEGLIQRFGPKSDFVLDFVNPGLWLDEARIAARGLELAAVERTVAGLALAQPGYAFAITKSELADGALPDDPLHQLVLASFDRERTGHVYLIPDTGWLQSSDAADLAAMHGTPYTYDRSVPIVFWGAGLTPQRVLRAVDPRDIAPTLAARLGVKAPSASTGRVLPEVAAP